MNPALAAALLLTIAAVPAVAQVKKPIMVDDKSVTMVEVISVFSGVPASGYAPVRIRAVNNLSTDMPVSMDVSAQAPSGGRENHTVQSRFSFTAPAGKTTERDFLVPVCLNVEEPGYYFSNSSLRATVRAGARSEVVNFVCAGHGILPLTAFSSSLAGKTLPDINKKMTSTRSYSSGDEQFAVLFEAGMLPADWRAYSGVDVMALSSTEWPALAAPVKSALLQWVKLGGSLNIYVASKQPATLASLGIQGQGRAGIGPQYGGEPVALGLGRVSTVPWDGVSVDEVGAAIYLTGNETLLPWVRRQEYAQVLADGSARGLANPLMEALGEKNFAAWQVGVVLVLFGILVGPVNLFVFAGKGRRHRLFFTTPIISLGAAAVLLVVIFFQDGTGGAGHRSALIYLDSAENSAFIHQMQVSRTGVLFGSTFDVGDESVVNMGILPDSRWTRLKSPERSSSYGYRRSSSEAQQYSILDKSCGGDWFQSRSEQGQFIDSVQSTRGRIELKPGSNPPVITSTLTAPLEQVWYVDDAGKFWASPGTATTGAEVTLTEKTADDFSKWRARALSMLPVWHRTAMKGHQANGFFYAVTNDARAGLVDTLSSINWQTNRSFIFGPLKK